MVNCQFQALDPGNGIGELLLDIRLIICKLPADLFADPGGFRFIGDEADPPEDDHAGDVQRPFTFPAESGVV